MTQRMVMKNGEEKDDDDEMQVYYYQSIRMIMQHL